MVVSRKERETRVKNAVHISGIRSARNRTISMVIAGYQPAHITRMPETERSIWSD